MKRFFVDVRDDDAWVVVVLDALFNDFCLFLLFCGILGGVLLYEIFEVILCDGVLDAVIFFRGRRIDNSYDEGVLDCGSSLEKLIVKNVLCGFCDEVIFRVSENEDESQYEDECRNGAPEK